MDQNQKLYSLLTELRTLTGIRLNFTSDTPEEVDAAIQQLQRLCDAYKEKYDKEYFLKSIISNDIPVYDIDVRASHHRINPEETRATFFLETKSVLNQTIITILKHMLPSKTSGFVIPVSDNQLVFLCSFPAKNFTESYLKEFALNVVETLNVEAFSDGWIACGPVIHHLSELPNAFQKMNLTLKIRNIFYSDQKVLLSSHLGTGRLIYELPDSACSDYLEEIFTQGIPKFDSEIMSVTNCFFENNLNIAETARRLHMHRNTLIYRLDQIEQMTGLNLRSFEDAMTFKIVLMILKRSLPYV